jgi:hypothetical protein
MLDEEKGSMIAAFCFKRLIPLETEVREGLVGFSHTVYVFTLFNRAALVLGCID